MIPNIREMLPNFLKTRPAIPDVLEKCPSLSDMQKHLPTISDLKDISAKVPNLWYRCPNTNKPEVCSENLWKIRAIVGGAAVAGGVAGYYILPTLGFGAIGPDPGTVAASWQSSIGVVPAGSWFSLCQSLGMTGTGTLMMGGTAAGLTLLAGAVASKKLDWCTCQYDMEQNKSKL